MKFKVSNTNTDQIQPVVSARESARTYPPKDIPWCSDERYKFKKRLLPRCKCIHHFKSD